MGVLTELAEVELELVKLAVGMGNFSPFRNGTSPKTAIPKIGAAIPKIRNGAHSEWHPNSQNGTIPKSRSSIPKMFFYLPNLFFTIFPAQNYDM